MENENLLNDVYGYLLKAVVNEDTQGNIEQLQAEIRQLKEELSGAKGILVTITLY